MDAYEQKAGRGGYGKVARSETQYEDEESGCRRRFNNLLKILCCPIYIIWKASSCVCRGSRPGSAVLTLLITAIMGIGSYMIVYCQYVNCLLSDSVFVIFSHSVFVISTQ